MGMCCRDIPKNILIKHRKQAEAALRSRRQTRMHSVPAEAGKDTDSAVEGKSNEHRGFCFCIRRFSLGKNGNFNKILKVFQFFSTSRKLRNCKLDVILY